MIDTILKALAPAVPQLIPAAHKGDMGGCSFYGFRPDGSRFLLMNILAAAGAAGRTRTANPPRLDVPGRRAQRAGRAAGNRISVAGRALRVARAIRRRRPLPRRPRPRSRLSGAGKTCKTNINCERTKDPPWGLARRQAGGDQSRSCGAPRRLGSNGCSRPPMIAHGAGRPVVFLTAGGGGFGDPRLRGGDEIARGHCRRGTCR